MSSSFSPLCLHQPLSTHLHNKQTNPVVPSSSPRGRMQHLARTITVKNNKSLSPLVKPTLPFLPSNRKNQIQTRTSSLLLEPPLLNPFQLRLVIHLLVPSLDRAILPSASLKFPPPPLPLNNLNLSLLSLSLQEILPQLKVLQ